MNRKRRKSTDDFRLSKSLVNTEEWQLGEIRAGLADLDAGRTVGHGRVAKWLKSWGQPNEQRAPRPW
jgi:predicted transcriptional regulator